MRVFHSSQRPGKPLTILSLPVPIIFPVAIFTSYIGCIRKNTSLNFAFKLLNIEISILCGINRLHPFNVQAQ